MGGKVQTAANRTGALPSPRLIKVVDSVPATRGMGVMLRQHGRIDTLRAPGGSGGSILFELRERHVNPAFMKPISSDRVPFASAGQRQAGWSVMRPGVKPIAMPGTPRTAPRPMSRMPNRTSASVPPAEWRALGLNCVGAAIGWIGVVGTGALAPITGGASGLATVALYAGAIAGSGQCMASVYRVNNLKRGRKDLNDVLDNSDAYYWTMLGADVIGLYGAQAGLRGAVKTAKALKSARVSAGELMARSVPRAVRGDLSIALGINGMKLGTRMINKVVRGQLLDGAAGVLGVVSSADGGLIRELVVWVIADEKGS